MNMELDLIDYENQLKLQSLLEKILEEAYNTEKDCYTNGLLPFCRISQSENIEGNILKSALTVEWILRAINLWEQKRQMPNLSFREFIMQLLCFVSGNEAIRENLLKNNIYNRVIEIAELSNDNSPISIKMAFIELLTTLLLDKNGRQWLRTTNYWNYILTLSLQSEDQSVIEQSHLFISLLLDANLKCDQDISSKIWQTIITPILKKSTERFSKRSKQNDEDIQKTIGPPIQLINYVLNYFLERWLQDRKSNMREFRSILSMSELIEAIKNYLILIESEKLSYEICKVWISLICLSLEDLTLNGILKVDIDERFMRPIFSILNILVDDSKSSCVLKCSLFILVQWNKLKEWTKIEYTTANKTYLLEEQFTYLLMMPSLQFVTYFDKGSSDLCNFGDMDLDEIYSMISEITLRLSYKWRNVLPFKYLINYSFKGIIYVTQLMISLPKKCRKICFLTLLYLMNNINVLNEKNNKLSNIILKSGNYMQAILIALAKIITNFSNDCQDYLASLQVLEVSIKFLMNKNCPPHLVVEDLRLISAAVDRYFSSSMAILYKEKGNSGIIILGSLLYSKLNESNSLIREAAVQVLTTVAKTSFFEFKSCQEIVLQNDLNKQIFRICLHDDSSLVRESALKCLNILVHIETVWTRYMECNMTEAIILLSKRENEVSVRTQVIIVLTTVFNFCSSFPHLQKQICETMCTTLINDNNTRVRLYSLLFWIKRIEEKLALYGMVDGKFPECVFSHNSKKILPLTETEIKKRLKCVLTELKEIDCFRALQHAVADKCDAMVSKKSWQISKKLNDLFDKYGVETDLRMELANTKENCT